MVPGGPGLGMLLVLYPLVTSWTGSHLASELSAVPEQEIYFLLDTLLPHGVDGFFRNVYDDHMQLVQRSESNFDPAVLVRRLGNLKDVFEVFKAEGLLYSKGVSMYSVDLKVPGRYDGKTTVPEGTDFEQFMARLRRTNYKGGGDSFLFRFEMVKKNTRPLADLEDSLYKLSGIPLSLHLYVSSESAQVLEPHTDPYDVLVLQLTGEKKWRTCVPNSNVVSQKYNISRALSDAQLCMLQELSLGGVKGCTTYSVRESDKLDCTDFLMGPGDVLYMPKGVVHYAQTNSESIHLTIGLHRWNMQWLDAFREVFGSLLKEQGLKATKEGLFLPNNGSNAFDRNIAKKLELLEWYAETAEGVHLQESIPGWLLQCYRTSCPQCMSKCSEAVKQKRAGELVDIFKLHFGLFERWLRRSTVRTFMDMGRLDLFWAKSRAGWSQLFGSGDLRIKTSLETIGNRVQTFHDTRNRKKKPTKPFRYVLRDNSREPPRNGIQTLCDKQRFWSHECRGSSNKSCIATYISRKRGRGKSCQKYCQMHGLYCNGSYPLEKEAYCSESAELNTQRALEQCDVDFDAHVCKCSLGNDGSHIPGFVLRDKRRSFQQKTGSSWSLCDEMDGWDTECFGSDPSRCEVLINIRQKFSCNEFCEAHNAVCETGWDDTTSVSCQRNEDAGESCDRVVYSQICRCVARQKTLGKCDDC